MTKPIPVVSEPYLNYIDCVDWINKKYDIRMDNYKIEVENFEPLIDNKYRNFWHHILKVYEVSNGTFFDMDVSLKYHDYFLEHYIKDDKWVLDIYRMFADEFGEYADEDGCLHFWVEW